MAQLGSTIVQGNLSVTGNGSIPDLQATTINGVTVGSSPKFTDTWRPIGTGATDAAAGNHTHNYAGSSSAGGAATSANKLNTNAGSATKPVYFTGGVPSDCTYSLNKTVPSDAYLSKSEIVNLIYPVGSVYISKNSTSPATLFGGTWSQIKDKFLMTKGDTYTTAGGSATVTLTTNNLPSHTHGFTPSGTITVTTDPTFTGDEITSSAGTAHSHGVGSINATGYISGGYGPLMDQGCSYYGIYYKYTTSGKHSISGSANTRAYPGIDLSRNRSGSTGDESAHTHTVTATGTVSGGAYSFTGTTGATDSAGSGTAFSILPPYDVVYAWERTA